MGDVYFNEERRQKKALMTLVVGERNGEAREKILAVLPVFFNGKEEDIRGAEGKISSSPYFLLTKNKSWMMKKLRKWRRSIITRED
jgi:hypothetical protein